MTNGIDKSVAHSARLRNLPRFKDVMGEAAHNFPKGYQWPVSVYVRQLRIENPGVMAAGKVLAIDTPHGRLYVTGSEYVLDPVT
jgi:hypothetical protein